MPDALKSRKQTPSSGTQHPGHAAASGRLSPVERLQGKLSELDQRQLRRRRRIQEGPCSAYELIDGRRYLAFCSNDYLGLANHPRLIAALGEGARKYGAGSGASPLISGHSQAHALLEEALAGFLAPWIPGADALSFSTGYMANLAILTSLAALEGPQNTAFFSEALNHASLIDGMRLSRGKVHVYPHADLQTLEQQLAHSTAATKVVVSDSVFSMDGCLADVPALLALAKRHDAWLLIDDAHGFGVLGEGGRGVLEHFGLRSDRLVYMGTLGKAAGLAGAFVCADTRLVDWMVQTARSYIYTTAAPPALAHALVHSLDIIGGTEGRQRRQHLQTLISTLQEGWPFERINMSDIASLSAAQHLAAPGFSTALLHSDTPIQPIVVGSNAAALAVAERLLEQGIRLPAIRPPTVPEGTARLRLTLSATHQPEDVNQLITVLKQLQT